MTVTAYLLVTVFKLANFGMGHMPHLTLGHLTQLVYVICHILHSPYFLILRRLTPNLRVKAAKE
jgi:hypothetical protein